jgi:hypothetical protein
MVRLRPSDDDDDLSSQLVRLRDGSHTMLPYSWTGSNRHAIKKNNEKTNRTDFNTVNLLWIVYLSINNCLLTELKVTLTSNVELHTR